MTLRYFKFCKIGWLWALNGEFVKIRTIFFCKTISLSKFVRDVFPHTILQYEKYGSINEEYSVFRTSGGTICLSLQIIPILLETLLVTSFIAA